MDNAKLVYSSDPKQNEKCPKCKELVAACVCVAEDDPKTHKFVAVLRIEKQSRGGKVVTVIDQLPKNKIFLQTLTTLLKKKCGSGGTFSLEGKEGLIEIQGDKRELIRALLAKENIKFKG